MSQCREFTGHRSWNCLFLVYLPWVSEIQLGLSLQGQYSGTSRLSRFHGVAAYHYSVVDPLIIVLIYHAFLVVSQRYMLYGCHIKKGILTGGLCGD